MSRVRTRTLLAALILPLVLLAACGGSDDDGGGDEEGAPPTTTARVGAEEAEGDPVEGGTLVIGVEAETDGWDPTANNWAVSGHLAGNLVYDSLAMFDENGEAQPYLAESFTPNDDFTEWTITLRPDITFHNGEPLNATAVKANLDAFKSSGLAGPVYSAVDSFEVVDDLNVRVLMNMPWATFPVALTSQAGYMIAPAALADGSTNQEPVGTGPFVFESWTPDSSFNVVKNEDYWQEGKPYLDAVEIRPIIPPDQRNDSLNTGGIDMLHTSDPNAIEDLRTLADAGDIELVEDGAGGEESFIMFNTEAPPVDDVNVRRALAHAVDLNAYVEVVDVGVRSPARSPFIETSPWHSEEAVEAYPEYDPAAATALIEEYEAENGPVEIVLKDTPGNETELAFIQQQWEAVGVDVETQIVEQGTHIVDTLAGDYQAVGWRLFGNPDPDGEYVWWDIDNANPIGEIALNFARFRNEDMQAAMDAGRSTTDFDERKAAYDEAQTIMNENVPYMWEDHTLWVFAGVPTLRNMAWYALPDGEPGLGVYAGFPGATKLTDLWIDE
jgi:peptide/nickel transport system substrate-binding protein